MRVSLNLCVLIALCCFVTTSSAEIAFRALQDSSASGTNKTKRVRLPRNDFNTTLECDSGEACEVHGAAEVTYTFIIHPNSVESLAFEIEPMTSNLTVEIEMSSPTAYLSPQLVSWLPEGDPIYYICYVPDGISSWSKFIPGSFFQGYIQGFFVVQLANDLPDEILTVTFKSKYNDTSSFVKDPPAAAPVVLLSASAAPSEDSSETLSIILTCVIGGVLIIIIGIVESYYLRKQTLDIKNQAKRMSDLENPGLIMGPQLAKLASSEVYKEGNFEQFESPSAPKQCTVCFNNFQKESACCQLPCEHIFHRDCFKVWFNGRAPESNDFCPTCHQGGEKQILKAQSIELPIATNDRQ